MPVFETDLRGIRLISRGKVRDIYEVGGDILIVATDRLSAFDVVLPTPIPDKGKVLTRMSLFWFDFLKERVPNHLLTADVSRYPDVLRPYEYQLKDRSMFVKKASPLPVECIVRGYLSGSGWSDYKKTGAVCGIRLPRGLVESQALPEPIFTPSTKAAVGSHDENISFEKMIELVGKDLAQTIRNTALDIYSAASVYARERGVIIADTKFEFGLVDGVLILIDEVLTPDSSRFWPVDSYRPGGPQPSFDKQFVRDYLESIGWDKKPPGPALPSEIVEKTRARYLEALKRLTGHGLEQKE
ncbi:MAG: phosphoribosylaminoimidazolesuccinocarboxamide synthase [Dissulfurimicrobium sp.]|uniref:phosphoribosylaminoimidazolesuccinocarboxamide synthase n=1 Tax=Dissulfurimicrobium TaxID=1769732 RepID=UPI003C72D73A